MTRRSSNQYKSKIRASSSSSLKTVRGCDFPDCSQKGEYPAPKSKDKLNDYFWFCIDHVREYNAKWDYYKGMTPEEIEDHLKEDTTWRRPTWPMGSRFKDDVKKWQKIREDIFDDFPATEADTEYKNQTDEWGHNPSVTKSFTKDQQNAFKLLEVEPPFSYDELKKNYRRLVKEYHPDRHGQDEKKETRLKEINHAFALLKKIFLNAKVE